jgi:D-3-phosphoglycerate dehydrogenase
MSNSTAVAESRKKTESRTVRIIVLDDIASEGLQMLRDTPDVEFEIHTGLSGSELQQALEGFDGAVCRSGVKITAEALQGNTTLRAITRAGVGTDNIDKEAATRLGIVVMNTPAGNTTSTAEHTMALMLGLSRNLAPAHASLKAGKWERGKFKGRQLCGKTLGIIGLGRIGQEVAKRAAAFGMKVVGYDPFLSDTQIEKLGVRPVTTVAGLIPLIDYLTVHTPMTPETRGLIGEKEIAAMKPGARLINCARGGIYDEAALLKGLESGHLGGVALDVYQQEPCSDSPLFQRDDVLCTPHLGASTHEAQIQVATEAVELLIGYLLHGEVRSAVNTTAIDPKTLDELRGYLDAAYRLGILLASWHDGGIESVAIEYLGELSRQDHRILTSSLCAGLLTKASPNVNIINAQAIAGERGIRISTSTNEKHESLNGLIRATVQGEGRSRRASVTVFGKDMPRLIGVGDYRTDAYIDGILLLMSTRDVPGVVGYVGEILGKEGVNITQLAVGRVDSSGGNAIGVLNLDSPASPEALEKVVRFDGIDAVDMIQLPAAGELPEWLR